MPTAHAVAVWVSTFARTTFGRDSCRRWPSRAPLKYPRTGECADVGPSRQLSVYFIWLQRNQNTQRIVFVFARILRTCSKSSERRVSQGEMPPKSAVDTWSMSIFGGISTQDQPSLAGFEHSATPKRPHLVQIQQGDVAAVDRQQAGVAELVQHAREGFRGEVQP